MYRIYDKQEKRWRADVIVFQDGTFGQITSAKGGYTLVDSSGLVLVRSTGLKDKSGEMIWEWDRVRCLDGSEPVVRFGSFHDGGFPQLGFYFFEDGKDTTEGFGEPMSEKYRYTRLGSSLEQEGE